MQNQNDQYGNKNQSWFCSNCGNENYSHRTHCYMRKCGASRDSVNPVTNNRPHQFNNFNTPKYIWHGHPHMKNFAGPHVANFGNQPQMGNFGNQPQMGNFENQPQIGNFGNQPQMGNFGNQPQIGNFENQPQMGNFENQPQMGNFENQPQMGNFENQPQMGNFGNQPQIRNFGNQPRMGNFGNQPQMRNFGIDLSSKNRAISDRQELPLTLLKRLQRNQIEMSPSTELIPQSQNKNKRTRELEGEVVPQKVPKTTSQEIPKLVIAGGLRAINEEKILSAEDRLYIEMRKKKYPTKNNLVKKELENSARIARGELLEIPKSKPFTDKTVIKSTKNSLPTKPPKKKEKCLLNMLFKKTVENENTAILQCLRFITTNNFFMNSTIID